MKREALGHAKFKLLARDLGCSLNEARGICATLWMVAGIGFPRGDIGRLNNEELAIALDHEGDADVLVAALTRRRLLDEIPEVNGRLYVHDWHEHCDDMIHAKLIGTVQTFANGVVPRVPDRRINADRLKALAAAYLERYGVTIGRECIPAPSEPRAPLGLDAVPLPTDVDVSPTCSQPVDDALPTCSQPVDDVLPTRCQRVDDALPLVLSTESKSTDPPLKAPPRGEPVDFADFWEKFSGLYPNRPGGSNLAAARRRLQSRLRGSPELAPVILDGVRRFRVWADLTGKNGTDEGVCHATTWVNQERWHEPYTVPSKGVGEPKTSPSAPRGPKETVDYESRPVRDESGSLVMRLVAKGSGELIDRAWVIAWFDVHDGRPDHRAAAELWCEAHGLRADDGFAEDAA